MSEAPPTTMTSLDYRRAAQTEVSGRLAPALVGILFFLGYLYFKGTPTVVDAHARIGLSCLPAIILAIFADRVPRLSRLLLLAVNFLAVLTCVVPTLIAKVQPGGWSWTEFSIIAAVIGLVVGGITTLTQMLQQRDGTSLTLLVMIGMTLATSALLLFGGIASIPQYTLTLVVGIVAVMVVGAFNHPLRTSRGIYTLVMSILAAQLASGHLWGADEGVPLWACAAVIGAPLYAWFARVPWIARRRPWQRIVVGLFLAALPATAAVIVTGVDYQRQSNSDNSGKSDDSSISPDSYSNFKP